MRKKKCITGDSSAEEREYYYGFCHEGTKTRSITKGEKKFLVTC